MARNALTSPLIDRPRVLAVEDDRLMRAVIERVLIEADIEVIAVEVVEAVQLIEDQDFDLVICDRTMPGMSGQEFLNVIRSKPRFDFTPFMFLTGSEGIDEIIAGLQAGADDYMTKPFHPSELAPRVASRLERARQTKRRQHEMVDIETLAFEVDRELTRVQRGGRGGVLALVDIPSLQAVKSSFGERERRNVLETIASEMGRSAESLDMLGATRIGDLAILMPETNAQAAADRLRAMATRAATLVTEADGVKVRPVPMIGFVEFATKEPTTSAEVIERAAEAVTEAQSTQDLQPRRWLPREEDEGRKTDHHPMREAFQVGWTFTLGIILPFLLYAGLYKVGVDVSWPVYLVVVLALVSTAALIWTEGIFATRHPGAPEVAGAPEPPASAIICAYMPN